MAGCILHTGKRRLLRRKRSSMERGSSKGSRQECSSGGLRGGGAIGLRGASRNQLAEFLGGALIVHHELDRQFGGFQVAVGFSIGSEGGVDSDLQGSVHRPASEPTGFAEAPYNLSPQPPPSNPFDRRPAPRNCPPASRKVHQVLKPAQPSCRLGDG